MVLFILAGLLWPGEVLTVMTFLRPHYQKDIFGFRGTTQPVDLSDPHLNEKVPDPEMLVNYDAIES